MRPPPWIDDNVISEGRKLAGVSLVRPGGVPVPPGQHMYVPAQRPPDVPPDVPPPDTPARPLEAVGPAGGSEGEMIVGIAAAAYLGYGKPDSFRRARTRHPIPGETKTPDGRPCWTPTALRSWQSKRKIAGHRTPAGGPD